MGEGLARHIYIYIYAYAHIYIYIYVCIFFRISIGGMVQPPPPNPLTNKYCLDGEGPEVRAGGAARTPKTEIQWKMLGTDRKNVEAKNSPKGPHSGKAQVRSGQGV